MEEKKAKLFVNTPNALAGNEISKCDTSSAAFQSEEAGIVDFVGDEAAILGQIRDLVCMLPSNNEDDNSFVECADDLNLSLIHISQEAARPISITITVCSTAGLIMKATVIS